MQPVGHLCGQLSGDDLRFLQEILLSSGFWWVSGHSHTFGDVRTQAVTSFNAEQGNGGFGRGVRPRVPPLPLSFPSLSCPTPWLAERGIPTPEGQLAACDPRGRPKHRLAPTLESRTHGHSSESNADMVRAPPPLRPRDLFVVALHVSAVTQQLANNLGAF